MSATASETDDELPSSVQALLGLSVEEERDTLDLILTEGHDQGWLLTGDVEVLGLAPATAAALFERAAEREPVAPSVPDAWSDRLPPAGEVPDEPAWAILTQRCDLVRSFATEPLVEVARVVKLSGSAAATAKANSPRLVYLCDCDDDVWAVDLRQRAVVAKTALRTAAARPVIGDPRTLKRFRLRLGQRYWRDPVPDDLVDTLQRPMISAVKGSAARIARFESFSAWLGVRDGGRVTIIPVAADGRLEEAKEDFSSLLEILQTKSPEAWALINHGETEVVTADDVPLSLWLDSFKFDFDEITYARRAGPDQADPFS